MITTVPVPDFLDMNEVKEYLNMSGATNDTELGRFMEAAQSMIVERVGQVSEVTAVEDRNGGRCTVILSHRPIVSITTVESLPGLGVVPEADEAAGTEGWVLANPEGLLEHTSRFPARIRVTYTAGRTPIPENYKQAGMELVSHLFETQRGESKRRPAFGQMGDDYPAVHGLPGAAYALPIRVRELLGLSGPHTDMPLVG